MIDDDQPPDARVGARSVAGRAVEPHKGDGVDAPSPHVAAGPTEEIIRRQLLDELRSEFVQFDTTFHNMRNGMALLPAPLCDSPTISLRHAEELRHGSDHIVHALASPDDPAFAESQLRDSLCHFRNLLPDFYMHMNGHLLRYCSDALATAGVAGDQVNSQALTGLVEKYGKIRIARTSNRTDAIAKSEVLFRELMDLAPRIVSATDAVIREGIGRVWRVRTERVMSNVAFAVGILSFLVGVVLYFL